jgi:hypothetical protein
MALLHVGDCAFLRATNGGHFPGSRLKLTIPAEQLGAFFFVGGFAYVATVLFGIPAFFLFRAKRWPNVVLYLLVGDLIGTDVSPLGSVRQ